MHTGSAAKYLNDLKKEDHGGKLAWPGTAGGFPVRGDVQHLKQSEFEELPVSLDFKSQIFYLYKPADKEEFEKVMDRIVNKWYTLYKRIDRWSDEHCGLVVWMEWVQVYGDVPQVKIPGGVNGQQIGQLESTAEDGGSAGHPSIPTTGPGTGN